MAETSSKITWIFQDENLIQRLDRAWSGETWRNDDQDGLAATLDAIPEWVGWDSWDRDKRVDELGKLLTRWEEPVVTVAAPLPQPEPLPVDTVPAPIPQPEPLSEDTSQPRWNPASEYWEVYNADRKAWWSYDETSDTWFDPEAQRWIPLQSNGVRSAPPPTGGAFDWVTAEQAQSVAQLYGGDWPAGLGAALNEHWGPGWQEHPAEHKQAWLTDLLPTLARPAPPSLAELGLVVPSIDLDDVAEDEDYDDEDYDDEDDDDDENYDDEDDDADSMTKNQQEV